MGVAHWGSILAMPEQANRLTGLRLSGPRKSNILSYGKADWSDPHFIEITLQ